MEAAVLALRRRRGDARRHRVASGQNGIPQRIPVKLYAMIAVYCNEVYAMKVILFHTYMLYSRTNLIDRVDHFTCTFITLIIFRSFNYFWIHMPYSLCYI